MISFYYLQEKNYTAAGTQFALISDSNVVSKYFDFKIDSAQLLQNVR